jgi:hypothetical protein
MLAPDHRPQKWVIGAPWGVPPGWSPRAPIRRCVGPSCAPVRARDPPDSEGPFIPVAALNSVAWSAAPIRCARGQFEYNSRRMLWDATLAPERPFWTDRRSMQEPAEQIGPWVPLQHG